MVCSYLIFNLIMFFSVLEMIENFAAMQMVFAIYCTSINYLMRDECLYSKRDVVLE